MLHTAQFPDSLLKEICGDSPDSDSDNTAADNFQCNIVNNAFQIFNQCQYSDLIRDLWLSMRFATI